MKRQVGMFLCFLFVLMSGVTVAPAEAGACSCAMPPPVEESVAQATAVFAGKVTAIEEPPPRTVMSSADPVRVTFEVDRVWKGVDTPKVVVSTALSSASCGYEWFEVDREYVVFAGGAGGELQTGMCMRTQPLASAGELLAELGEASAPTRAAAPLSAESPAMERPAEPSPPERGAVSTAGIWVGVGAALLLSALAWLAYRRLRRG